MLVKFKGIPNRQASKSDTVIWLRMNMGVVTLFLLFIVGVMLGAFTACKLHNNGIFSPQFTVDFLSQRRAQTAAQTFFSALTPNIIAWGIVFICGFCAVSMPIIILVPFIRGLGHGVLASCLLLYGGDIAPRYICAILLPNVIISAATLVFCCREAMAMSRYFWSSMAVKPRGEGNSAALFCGKMLLYGIFIAAGAALEAYSHTLFF